MRHLVASLDAGWRVLVASANAARHERERQENMAEIHALIHPPQPQEPEIVVIEAEPDPVVRAHRWWG